MYDIVQIFLKTLGGDTILVDVPLQVLTVGQLRKAFVEKVCTVRRGIGVAESFYGRWNRELPPLRRNLAIQLQNILQLPTGGNNYKFTFAGSNLDDTKLLSDCGVEKGSILHVEPRSTTLEWYALRWFLTHYE